MTKVLVVGSRGFIGSELVKNLKEQELEVVEFDLALGNDISQGVIGGYYDIIYNLATVSLIEARTNVEKAIDVNVKGMVNVLECARRCNAKVILSSASSVYGIPTTDKVKENMALNPVSIYGATKVAAELLVETYHKLYNIDYFIFRFTNVYGNGQRVGVIKTFFEKMKKDEPIVISGSGKQKRDFVYINDVVRFLMYALSSDIKNDVVNLGSGTVVTINELLAMCMAISNKKLKIEHVQKDIDERWGFRADLSKLESIFNEVPETEFEEGLKNVWEEREDEDIVR